MADEIKLNPAEAETAINKLNSVMNNLMDTHWSCAAKEQFKVNVKEWQSQVGKFLEEAESVNGSFSEILNKTTVELQKRSDEFIDCIKK